MTGVQILRDYLYLDVEKVKSIAGQLQYGVPEESRQATRNVKRGNVGWSAVLSFSPESGEENAISRSTLDSLFPELEGDLEAGGWLVDISDVFGREGQEALDVIKQSRPEASIFRVTASGYLFDSRYLADIMGGFSAAVAGLSELAKSQPGGVASTGSSQKSPGRKGNQSKGQQWSADNSSKMLEDSVEDFPAIDDVSAAYLRSILHISRGLYKPGLNLVLSGSSQSGAMTIGARLQENRRYLDADPDIIGSRFGMLQQPWTIVGTVGHYSHGRDRLDTTQIANSMRTTEEQFDRNGFIKLINSVIQNVGSAGIADLPQHPGMSAIPIAVYRSASRGVSTEVDPMAS